MTLVEYSEIVARAWAALGAVHLAESEYNTNKTVANMETWKNALATATQLMDEANQAQKKVIK